VVRDVPREQAFEKRPACAAESAKLFGSQRKSFPEEDSNERQPRWT
jgi:hypothetical protein